MNPADGCTKVKFSRLNLVDLAGMSSSQRYFDSSETRMLKMAVPESQLSCLHLVGLASMCCTLSQAQSPGHRICSCVRNSQKEQHYWFLLLQLGGPFWCISHSHVCIVAVTLCVLLCILQGKHLQESHLSERRFLVHSSSKGFKYNSTQQGW